MRNSARSKMCQKNVVVPEQRLGDLYFVLFRIITLDIAYHMKHVNKYSASLKDQ